MTDSTQLPSMNDVSGCFLTFLFSILFFSSSSYALSDSEVASIARRQLLTLPQNGVLPHNYESIVQLDLNFENPRLRSAYIALQAWKKAVYSDPKKMTHNWEGPDVCSYKGVFCAPALDDPNLRVVAGIDLNHADIAGYFPAELGLLTDMALLHINSNRFCGIIPKSFSKLKLLFELDVSNNRFVGPFPEVVMSLSSLKYLDLRFNNFEGELPPKLFEMKLDALFLNNNRFKSNIPETFGYSPASVIVVANNQLTGCIPTSIGKMCNTLNEIIFQNNNMSGCLPSEIGMLGNVTVLDVSSNSFSGVFSKTFKGLAKIEDCNVAHNMLTGFVPNEICKSPSLNNFTFSYNYFNGEAGSCSSSKEMNFVVDDTSNCLPDKPKQKSVEECQPVISRPVDCGKSKCGGGSSPSKPNHHHHHHHQNPSPNPKPSSPPPVHSPPPIPKPVHSPPPVHSPTPPIVHSPPPPVHSPPPPVVHSPPPLVHSPPPPVHSPPPPVLHSPPPVVEPPPAPVVSEPQPKQEVILPPNFGFQYASPPPPIFPGY